ncbi:pyruvate kinase, partial [Vibrio parahaemolyticus]
MTSKLRRTKIVTTLGPSTDKDNVLEEIIKAGANVV